VKGEGEKKQIENEKRGCGFDVDKAEGCNQA
jgi:hypothetical protein